MSFVNKIVQGDCLEIMRRIPDAFVDAIITDVPYNLGHHTQGLIKFKDREDMNKANVEKWNKDFDPIAFLPEAKRILKPQGNIFIYCSYQDFGKYYEWLEANFARVFFGVWHKTNPCPSVRKHSFLSSCELFLCAWNDGHKWNFQGQNEMHNFIETGICQGEERTEHTAQKPMDVMLPLIEASTNRGDIVLDPYCGSGSTCAAAREIDRRFIGIEIDPKYWKIANKRLQAYAITLDKFIEKKPIVGLIPQKIILCNSEKRK